MTKELEALGMAVIGVGRRGKKIAEHIEKECWAVPCFSILDEKELACWEETEFRGNFVAIIVAGMDDANEEALAARLIKAARKKQTFTVVIMGDRGNNYTEIIENSGAVILCPKDRYVSEEEQDQKLGAAVRGLAGANILEAEVFLEVSDITAVLKGECQFGEGADLDASVAVKQAKKELHGRQFLLCFFVPEGVPIYGIHKAMEEAQDSLGENANIIFGIKIMKTRGKYLSSGQQHTYWRRARLVLTKTPGRIPAFLPDKPVEKMIQVMAYTSDQA